LGFDEAALRAARNSRWTPAVEDGVKVDAWVQLKVDFRL
jgi:outer membrane biosynthesis protein TonB